MKGRKMNKLLIVAIIFPLLGMADEAYDEFLDLKQKGVEARNVFYHSLSNGLLNTYVQWQGSEWGGTLTSTNVNGGVSNTEYYVDLVKVSTNFVSTNLTQISQCFLNGEGCCYSYQRGNGNLTMIETTGRHKGDFKIYQVDSNVDLDCYFAATNFVGVHGIRQYQNGTVVQEGPAPSELLRLLKESVGN